MPKSTGLFALAIFLLGACSDSADAGGDAASDAAAPSDATTSGDTSHHDDDAGPVDAGPDVALPACAADGGIPDELRCTGLYADWNAKAIAPDAHYYEPAFKLWSDGAAKRRWIALPAKGQIDTSDMDEWT